MYIRVREDKLLPHWLTYSTSLHSSHIQDMSVILTAQKQRGLSIFPSGFAALWLELCSASGQGNFPPENYGEQQDLWL